MLKKIKALTRKWRMTSPSEVWLKQMYETDWGWFDYQSWIFRYEYITQSEWVIQRKNSRKMQHRPLVSIITPVYNVAPAFLRACVESVLFQSYPNWELLLVDDASNRKETIQYLEEIESLDSRIKVYWQKKNAGICDSTNWGISLANGEYIAFLDHDDKIAPDALYELCSLVNREKTSPDIIYSDRDMLSPGEGLRFMHLLKPEWAPETLFASNYLCHFTSYRRKFIQMIGGLEKDTEGSQDHDLILRAAEHCPVVCHIPKILYHWRQHALSVSLNPESKEYAYRAARLSLEKTLVRRGLRGTVEEIPSLWRGNYRIKFAAPARDQVYVLRYAAGNGPLCQIIEEQVGQIGTQHYVVFLDTALTDISAAAEGIEELVSWFQIEDVALVTGKIVNSAGNLLHAGLVQRKNGKILTMYQGLDDEKTPGYMAWAATAHNVSLAHPACFAMRWHDLMMMRKESIWKEIRTVYDLSLFIRQQKRRIVYTPFAKFQDSRREAIEGSPLYTELNLGHLPSSLEVLRDQDDPYYSMGLTEKNGDIALNFSDIPFLFQQPE